MWLNINVYCGGFICIFSFSGRKGKRGRLSERRPPSCNADARSDQEKCHSTQQVLKFDIWHQRVVWNAPAAALRPRAHRQAGRQEGERRRSRRWRDSEGRETLARRHCCFTVAQCEEDGVGWGWVGVGWSWVEWEKNMLVWQKCHKAANGKLPLAWAW